MEWIGVAGAAAAVLYEVVRRIRDFREREDLSLAPEAGLEVAGVSGAETDHLVVGQVEGPLELSQVGGVQVGQLSEAVQTDTRRTRTFKSFACCGGTLSIHFDR